MLYELFDAALRSAGIGARRRGRFTDRGDGLLALIDPADQARLVNLVLPAFGQLLTSYNANLPHPDGRDRQLRVRVVIHAGNVHDDDNGYFGEALDAAFRLLDAPLVKAALREAHGPLLLVGSANVDDPGAPYGRDGVGYTASDRPITAEVARPSGLDPHSPRSGIAQPNRHGHYRPTGCHPEPDTAITRISAVRYGGDDDCPVSGGHPEPLLWRVALVGPRLVLRSSTGWSRAAACRRNSA